MLSFILMALRRIYTAPSVDAAERELATLESMRRENSPRIDLSWCPSASRISVCFTSICRISASELYDQCSGVAECLPPVTSSICLF
jgi:hypothetical protein